MQLPVFSLVFAVRKNSYTLIVYFRFQFPERLVQQGFASVRMIMLYFLSTRCGSPAGLDYILNNPKKTVAKKTIYSDDRGHRSYS